MNLPSETIKNQIAQALVKGLANLGIEEKLEDVYRAMGSPPNLKMGHIAFPCFPYARVLRKGPPQIVNDLNAQIDLEGLNVQAKPTGPYLNFVVDAGELGDKVCAPILSGETFKRKLTIDPPKSMIEYSQPNTHKELHVGHLRNMCLGDALIRLHRYCGFDIISSTFPGDMGAHVAKCLWFYKYHNTDPVPTENKGAWLGKMYSAAHIKLEDERESEKEPQNRAQLTEILKELESGKGEMYELWKETREWSIEQMNTVYEWADVHFDKWYWESEVDGTSLKLVKEYFEKGVFTESRGAIGVDLSEQNLGFALLLKTDGTGLYATKDLELARQKFEDYKIEKNIYVVDNRQELHFKQVFKVLELMGFEQAKDCYHLAYEMVELPDGPMSSRKGNIIPVVDLINNLQTTITSEYLEEYRGDWSDEEIALVAKMNAKGAVHYGMLRYDPNSKIIFDMKEWINVHGESGPAIQMAVARINSMCKKLGFTKDKKVDWALLDQPQEIAMMVKMMGFNDAVLYACNTYKISHLCTYLYELGKLLNSFYAAVIIRDTENEVHRNTRLALTKAVGKTLTQGLALIGIPVPERM